MEVSRKAMGRVSVYEHHGGWWIYYRQDGKSVRRLVGDSALQAECEASLINAKLTATAAGFSLDSLSALQQLGLKAPVSSGDGTTPSTSSATVPQLRNAFLAHHQDVLHSSLATVARYRTATLYLETFANRHKISDPLGIDVTDFIGYLRSVEVSPNGHSKSAKRRLRDKGVLYVLETCRSLYHFGTRKGLLPRQAANPFTEMRLGSFRIRDAKPVFVFTEAQELAFFQNARWWPFALHFVLAKTGLRPGELVHALIEDVDPTGGWLSVCCKAELGWITKTNRERKVPLVPEVIAVLKNVIGNRSTGPLFLREKTKDPSKLLQGGRSKLAQSAAERIAARRTELGRPLTRQEEAKIHRRVWSEAGAVKVDRIRTSFIATAKAAGFEATCPKSWRHTFATLLQQANVDLLVRQQTMGHQPASAQSSALGMTGVYTHTSPDFQKREIDRALRQRPASLLHALDQVAKRIGDRSARDSSAVPTVTPIETVRSTRRSMP
jgi:integrase